MCHLGFKPTALWSVGANRNAGGTVYCSTAGIPDAARTSGPNALSFCSGHGPSNLPCQLGNAVNNAPAPSDTHC
ncbi:hypothetical protein SKAU_G00322480 [Synaphobranchus kaupii]|uniref:Uncharacterized protein n=1 Tax=Synaphobranchus kaupii TaxID=118154 RepID=A0A9Q1ENX8_SYNKA|nr:hypothetical protein SKAU_G00322480 [Synaphobranchus kaupii]